MVGTLPKVIATNFSAYFQIQTTQETRWVHGVQRLTKPCGRVSNRSTRPSRTKETREAPTAVERRQSFCSAPASLVRAQRNCLTTQVYYNAVNTLPSHIRHVRHIDAVVDEVSPQTFVLLFFLVPRSECASEVSITTPFVSLCTVFC